MGGDKVDEEMGDARNNMVRPKTAVTNHDNHLNGEGMREN